MHYAYTCRQTPSHFQILFYLSPCAPLFYSSRPFFMPLPPSISVCLSRYFFCNQAEHCLGYFYTFLTLVCLLLSLPSLSPLFLPSLLQSSNQCCAVCSASSISLPLSALMPFFLSPPLLLHCLSVLLFPPSHSVTKQLKALYMPISLPQTRSLVALSLPLPRCLPQHLFVLKKWEKQRFSG